MRANMSGTAAPMRHRPVTGVLETMSACRRVRFSLLLTAATCAWLPCPNAAADDAYRADFQGQVGPEWSARSTAATNRGGRRFLGPFANGGARLRLTKLPAHRFLTVRFDLLILSTWDGDEVLTGDGAAIGPDQWGLRVVGGPTLVHATFNNDTPTGGTTQSFPANLHQAAYPPRTGAVENNTLGGRLYGDSVYRVSCTFPHTARALELDFYGLNLQSVSDESWGLDNLVVSTATAHLYGRATEADLRSLWEDLIGEDPIRSDQAVWRLACAGERAVALIDRQFPSDAPAAVDPRRVQRLIDELDSDDWQTRHRATEALTRMGPQVLPALRAALARDLSAEARMRIEGILRKARQASDPTARGARRSLRAARVLELIGTRPAGKLAARLLNGPVGAEAIRPGSRWVGVRSSRGGPVRAMVLVVEQRKGDRFAGTVHVPTLGTRRRRFAGTIHDNRVEFTERDLPTGGEDHPPGNYRGRIIGRTLTGWWRPGEKGGGAGFKLRPAGAEEARP